MTSRRIRGMPRALVLAVLLSMVAAVSEAASRTSAPAPIISLAAAPNSVATGGSSLLSWATANADRCKASGGWNGRKPAQGTYATGSLKTAQTYALQCAGPGGTTSAKITVQVVSSPPPTPTPTPPLAPATALTANPTSIASGATSTLTWSATNADGCVASGAWSGSKAVNGTQSVGPLTANSNFSLMCTGAGGTSSATATVVVQQPAAAPTLSFAASPSSVLRGESATLTWSTTNATSCAASGSWSGAKAASGTQTTGALTTNASYTLTCTGAGGSVSQTAVVTVIAAAPTLTLTATPASVLTGSASNLTWNTTNATSCTASGDWSGVRGISGTQSTGALTANSSFTLACAGSGGTVTRTVTVTTTAGAPSVSLSANPPGVPRNSNTTLSWTSANVTSCAPSGGWSGIKATSGSESVGPITQDTTYTLSCTGAGGNAVAMTTVSLREAVLSWQAPTQNIDGSPLTNLSGYTIYYGTATKNYTQTVGVSGASTTTRTLSLAPGTYYFAVTAVDSTGAESAKTNEVSKTVN